MSMYTWEILDAKHHPIGTLKAPDMETAVKRAEILLDGIRPFLGVRCAVGRPPIADDTETLPALTVSAGTRRQLQLTANHVGRSVPDVIRTAIETYLARHCPRAVEPQYST